MIEDFENSGMAWLLQGKINRAWASVFLLKKLLGRALWAVTQLPCRESDVRLVKQQRRLQV
jgi:hypothetical protein